MRSAKGLALLALLPWAAAARAQEAPALTEQAASIIEASHLASLHSQYLAVWQSLDPEAASLLGLHEFDNKLTSRDDASYLKVRANMERFLLLLRGEVHPDRLKPSDLVDYEMFKAGLETGLYDYDRGDYRRLRPQVYIDMRAVYGPLIKDYGALIGRTGDALARLEALPSKLNQGRLLVGHPPRIWTEQAVADCTGALAFLRKMPDFYQPLYSSDAALEGRVKAAVEGARDAIESYRDYLKEVVLPRSDGSFAIGREAYDHYVRETHRLDLDAPKIESLARSEMKRAVRLLRKAARAIDSERDWWDLLEDAGKNAPAASGVIPALQAETARAYDQVRRRDVAGLPPGDLKVVETPGFMRSLIPFTAYEPPAPLDEGRQGEILVSPIDASLPQADQDALLAQAYNSHVLQNMAAGLAYPGAHVQASFLKQQPSSIRKAWGTPVLADGWSLYAEELAFEAEAYTSELARLTQLRRRLLAAARAVVDVRVHAKGMSYEDAVDYLVKEVRIPRLQAQAEVLRITQEPTRGMCAIVGYSQILKVRERVEHWFGSDFNMRQFHDRLLSYGAVPPALINKEMERDWLLKE